MPHKVIQQRNKCIGCNACVDMAPQRWRMSRADGRSTLIGGVEKKGFWSADIDPSEVNANRIAAAVCPVKIIQVIESD